MTRPCASCGAHSIPIVEDWPAADPVPRVLDIAICPPCADAGYSAPTLPFDEEDVS